MQVIHWLDIATQAIEVATDEATLLLDIIKTFGENKDDIRIAVEVADEIWRLVHIGRKMRKTWGHGSINSEILSARL